MIVKSYTSLHLISTHILHMSYTHNIIVKEIFKLPLRLQMFCDDALTLL